MRQFKIIRPKIVPPLADAVRFIHDEERDTGGAKPIERFRLAKLFGREKNELNFTVLNALERLLLVCGGERRVNDSAFCELAGLNGFSLIFLEGDERRDDDGRPREQAPGDLING